jgi:UPF0755 protein
MKKKLIIPALLVCLLLFSGAGYLYYIVAGPNSTESTLVRVEISPGQSFRTTAARLHSLDLVKNEDLFYVLGRLTGQSREIKAGHFEVDSSWNMIKMLDHLTTGKEVLSRLRITEGLTWWQVGRILEEEGLADFQEFEELVHDPEFLGRHSVFAESAEGFLYPETYYISPTRDVGARRLISIMISQFWKSTHALWQGMEFEEIYRTVNMASLIEKETGVSHERKIISGVFHNRIRKNMLFQCDPTIIYGLGEEFDVRIRRSHLDDRDNPYNTYQHRGFPPTPICSPGFASLEAALFPDEHDYLYFVSRNDGSHHFSKSLLEHNRAVGRYQRGR